MVGIALGIIGSILLISVGWFFFRKRTATQEYLALPPPTRKKQSAWWYKNRYSAELPDVHLYGGSHKTNIVTNEYPSPSDQQVNTSHLNDTPFPYISRQKLFSVAEQALIKALKQAFYLQPYHIFAKVRLSDVLDTLPDLVAQKKRTAVERIRQKRLDFLICQASTTEIIGVITLDDEFDEQKRLDSQIQDRFVDMALAAAQIPLLHLPPKTNYSVATLRKLFNRSFNIRLPLIETHIVPLPACPKCGATLKKMRVKNGVHAGESFWVCSDHPVCKTLFPISESVKT